MKETMDVEALSRTELLTFLSILEGELEAQDVVIHAFRAQHRDAFIQERYGQYNLSDPFLALQRDSKSGDQHTLPRMDLQDGPVGPNPLAVLKIVMSHCKQLQERMMDQLAAVENRHRRVIADLQEEKRKHMQDSAQNDHFTYMLQTERDCLLQQLEAERAAVQRLQKEQAQAVTQVEESLSQQQDLSSTLSVELQRASSQAQEEAQKANHLQVLLQEERTTLEQLQAMLEAEKSRAAQLEARSEKQLAEFDTEREQLKVLISKEKEKSGGLEKQVDELNLQLAALRGCKEEPKTKVSKMTTSVQTEPDGSVTPKSMSAKTNGHHLHKELPHEATQENGSGVVLHSPLSPHPQSPSSTAASSLSSSPLASPVLTKRPSFQSSYQAGVNQRFQAARHKFQAQAELEQQQHGCPLSPRDLSPTTSSISSPAEYSSAKQLARNTVTQVLSRFTSQQGGVKLAPTSNSPFGTDYRNLAASPTGGRSPSGPLSPGIRSPLTPRSEKIYPPPIPPKKPGMSPTPGSPLHSAQSSLFPELTGNCGHNSGQEGSTEPDLVLSSGS
ncbi:CTTNBP2 N-terminal-like protein [Synchiropus splendidus]|uniref:CTTNBP2 N-terminal-like protein n=1 Tax=Synchiropus splendidus TaxID=270530 RepID=UPI00237D3F02|nr:CTTNBP2 N-terminal-like protein [Synchiropus splendidus]